MSEIGDDFAEINERQRQKRASNTEQSTTMLQAAGIAFRSFNGGVHLQIEVRGQSVNFWPSTGLYMVSDDPRKRRGIRNLIRFVKGDSK